MYYVIQERLRKEFEWDDLIKAMDRLELEYEVVKLRPFIDDIEFETDRKDVFVFGALKMARITPKYGWYPGVLMTPNHDFQVYREHYKENLLNYDSTIHLFGNLDLIRDSFVRPTLDTKTFTGKVFTPSEWREHREYSLKNGHVTTLTENTEVQVAPIKNIQKEFRFFIVDGKLITGSLYKEGYFIRYDSIVDEGAKDFCNEMIKVFDLAPAYVMDICLTDGEWKIIECGTVNCAGLYKINIPLLLMALEDKFNGK